MKSLFFSKKYKITIAQPCQESWGNMHPVADGRFCDSCSKSVVDYSNMSEREVNERMRNASPHQCGRFRKEQLEKVYTLQPKIQLSAQRRFFQYLLTILLGSKAFVNKANAQAVTDTLKTERSDTLELLVQADSNLADTVALAVADTQCVTWDSTWVTNVWPDVITVSGTYIVEIDPNTLMGNWVSLKPPEPEYPAGPSAFDSIRESIARVLFPAKKEPVVKENILPKNKEPKPPLKEEERIVAILPDGIKTESEE